MFSCLVLIGILHLTATDRLYYWNIWWFDLVMHFLGGFWIAAAVFWKSEWLKLPFKLTFASVIGTVVLVGGLWEVWEYWAGLTFASKSVYHLDLSLDLLMDTIGGVAAYALCIRRKRDVQG